MMNPIRCWMVFGLMCSLMLSPPYCSYCSHIGHATERCRRRKYLHSGSDDKVFGKLSQSGPDSNAVQMFEILPKPTQSALSIPSTCNLADNGNNRGKRVQQSQVWQAITKKAPYVQVVKLRNSGFESVDKAIHSELQQEVSGRVIDNEGRGSTVVVQNHVSTLVESDNMDQKKEAGMFSHELAICNTLPDITIQDGNKSIEDVQPLDSDVQSVSSAGQDSMERELADSALVGDDNDSRRGLQVGVFLAAVAELQQKIASADTDVIARIVKSPCTVGFLKTQIKQKRNCSPLAIADLQGKVDSSDQSFTYLSETEGSWEQGNKNNMPEGCTPVRTDLNVTVRSQNTTSVQMSSKGDTRPSWADLVDADEADLLSLGSKHELTQVEQNKGGVRPSSELT